MFLGKIDEQTIALAGLYQSCQVVSKIAWKGEYNEKDLNPLINCILKIDSTDTEDIYIDISNLKTGLVNFKKQIDGDIFTRSSETRRYIESLKQLSYKLMTDDKCINEIQIMLRNLDHEVGHMTIDEKTIQLATIYQKTLSTFEPRIVVNGENSHLTDKIQASRIRTALFAGVRSLILWQQLGGSKLKLFFLKGQYSKQIDKYLNMIKN